ncbi:MAG: DNA mismatch repair endonuclease MutL [Candidatus Kapaibacteriales bacterium]
MIKKKYDRIQILPEFVANQIAAGEVVQRPESVVKELVENSLDASAETIAVVIHGGGKKLIHVVDDGIGMSKDDLLLSIRRHATSKIFNPEDLEEIWSYGFRGEALASIAAVAQLEIRTRQANDPLGWRLYVEPNKAPTLEPISIDCGTQVFVKNLFYNTPARRKFLKSDITEFRYITDTLMRIALARTDVRFVFYDEDSLVFDVKKSSLEERIRALLGDLVADSILKVDFTANDVHIWGYIGQPYLAKSIRGNQFFYLNSRSIRSRPLTYAVLLAYEHLLEKQTTPFFLINIDLEPRRYDVNVHPQKHEVKFDDERFIFNIVNQAVANSLATANLAPSVSITKIINPVEKLTDEKSSPLESPYVNKLTGEIIDFNQNRRLETNFRRLDLPRHSSKLKYQPQSDIKRIEQWEQVFAPLSDTEAQSKNYRTIVQFHNKYILLEKEDGILIIDQHAAHERILFERAGKYLENKNSITQNLLFPTKIQVNPSEFLLLKEFKDDFLALGFRFELLNESAIELIAVPSDISGRSESTIFREILADTLERNKIAPSSTRENLRASFSCKSAIKTGQALSTEEMQSLIEELFQCHNPYACPHGRPIMIEIRLTELDKNFCRIL